MWGFRRRFGGFGRLGRGRRGGRGARFGRGGYCKRLSDLEVGERGIVYFRGNGNPMMRRLMALGFVPGTPVEVVRVAPFGDPVEYAIRGSKISLRRDEAALIPIQPLAPVKS